MMFFDATPTMFAMHTLTEFSRIPIKNTYKNLLGYYSRKTELEKWGAFETVDMHAENHRVRVKIVQVNSNVKQTKLKCKFKKASNQIRFAFDFI